MNTIGRGVFWASALLTAVLGLSGCSSDDTSPASPGSSTKDGGGGNAVNDGGACSSAGLATSRDQCAFTAGALPSDTIGSCTGDSIPIKHIVVMMQENRSFDHYFGHLKGHGQDDIDVAADTATNAPAPDGGMGAAVPWTHQTSYCFPDTDHTWVASHTEWDQGRNDGFAIANSIPADPTGGRAVAYFEQGDLPFYYQLASTFAISDRYFCSLLGPTFPNRMYLYAGTSFGRVSTTVDPDLGLAPIGAENIFDVMNKKGITWKEYKTDLAGSFLFQGLSPTYYVDATEFAKDAAADTLPEVSFIDPSFVNNSWLETDEHPPSDMQVGQHWVWEQIDALVKSPAWASSALFLTYDEHGGLFDHVAPPAACKPDDTPPAEHPELGGFDTLGFRVPLILLSPYAKRHFVSHQVHSHTSILRFIEAKFDLPALTNRDANSDAMLDLFDFDSPPDTTVPAISEPPRDPAQISACKIAFPNLPTL